MKFQPNRITEPTVNPGALWLPMSILASPKTSTRAVPPVESPKKLTWLPMPEPPLAINAALPAASGLVKNHEAATCAADRAGMKCEGPVTCRRAVAKNDLGRVGVIGCGAIHDKLATACARVPVKTNETGAGKADRRAIGVERTDADSGRAAKK